ncbi:hypothetical protein ACUXCC_000895 [Cytobacillus horneckiae]
MGAVTVKRGAGLIIKAARCRLFILLYLRSYALNS